MAFSRSAMTAVKASSASGAVRASPFLVFSMTNKPMSAPSSTKTLRHRSVMISLWRMPVDSASNTIVWRNRFSLSFAAVSTR